jgi:hypothetical protein
MPGYYHNNLVSNVIGFSDIYIEFGKWNVVELKINVRPEMFSFILIEDYLFRKGHLLKTNWPIYNYIK